MLSHITSNIAFDLHNRDLAEMSYGCVYENLITVRWKGASQFFISDDLMG